MHHAWRDARGFHADRTRVARRGERGGASRFAALTRRSLVTARRDRSRRRPAPRSSRPVRPTRPSMQNVVISRTMSIILLGPRRFSSAIPVVPAAAFSAVADAHCVFVQQVLLPGTSCNSPCRVSRAFSTPSGLPSGSRTGMFLKPRAFMTPHTSWSRSSAVTAATSWVIASITGAVQLAGPAHHVGLGQDACHPAIGVADNQHVLLAFQEPRSLQQRRGDVDRVQPPTYGGKKRRICT